MPLRDGWRDRPDADAQTSTLGGLLIDGLSAVSPAGGAIPTISHGVGGIEQNGPDLLDQAFSDGAIAPGTHPLEMRLPEMGPPAMHAATAAEVIRLNGPSAGQQTELPLVREICEAIPAGIAPRPDHGEPARLRSAIAPTVAAGGGQRRQENDGADW